MMIFDKIIKDEDEVKNIVNESLSRNSNLLLTYFNQNCYNHYISQYNYRDLIDKRFTVYIDGIGIYFALKYLGYESVEKFNASDFNYYLFDLFAKGSKRIFLIGGNFSEAVIQEVKHKKCLNICGYKNGFFNNDELPNLIKEIDKSGADIILIGMGVPKQEFLAYELSEELNVDLIICVGNFFEFYFDTKKRAPEFLGNSGFEWVFRLLTEPKRLWKRYLVGIPLFLYRIYKMKSAH